MSGVSEDEDVGVGLVIVTLIKICDDVAAELISAKIKSAGIGFARILR